MADSSALDSELKRVDQVLDQTTIDRNTIKEKLLSVVSNMNIDPNAKPSEIEAKMNIVTTAAGILNDIDKNATTKVNIKMKHKENTDTASSSQQVIDLLRRYNGQQGHQTDVTSTAAAPNHEAASAKLEEAFTATGSAVLETELRESPTDVE